MWIICKQTIHMKFQALFSLKNNKMRFRLSSAIILLNSILRVTVKHVILLCNYTPLLGLLILPLHSSIRSPSTFFFLQLFQAVPSSHYICCSSNPEKIILETADKRQIIPKVATCFFTPWRNLDYHTEVPLWACSLWFLWKDILATSRSWYWNTV